MSTAGTLASAPGSSVSSTLAADEFQALEQRVLRAVEVVRREREARSAAEAELGRLKARVSEQAGEIERIERMLHQMDELL